MRVTVNGEFYDVDRHEATLRDVLLQLALPLQRVAIEQNGDLIPRDAHPTTPVVDGDVLEIVTLVGGG